MAARDRSLASSQAIDYIRTRSVEFGLDPDAVLAVASQEGLGGGIGDSGTSFGPWQLHYGGAYPSSAPRSSPGASQAWAWSPKGIDYALSRMSKVAANQSGIQAIRSIVTGFERPRDPQREITGAVAAYGNTSSAGSRQRPGFFSRVGGFIGGAASGAASGVESAGETAWKDTFGAASSVVDVLRAGLWLLNPRSWLRMFEGFVGVVFMLAGIFFISKAARGAFARSAGKLASIAPVGRTAKSAKAAASGGARAVGAPSELTSARVRTEQARTKEVQSRRRAHVEQRMNTRKERERRERTAMYEGAIAAERSKPPTKKRSSTRRKKR